MGAIGWVDGLETPVFHEALECAGVEELSFLDKPLHHGFGRGFHFFFHEGHHGYVAFDLDVFADVETLWRCAGS